MILSKKYENKYIKYKSKYLKIKNLIQKGGIPNTLPLSLLAIDKSYFGMLVWLQLCNPQGVRLFSFVSIPQRVPRPFACIRVYDMYLTHAERLRVVGCGLKGKLVRQLSHSVGGWGACHQMMLYITRRIASKQMAAVRNKAAKEAEELCALGQCAAALIPLQQAIDMGHLPSRALMAWLLIKGREGIAKDLKRSFQLVKEGAHLDCHHCQGVLAYCYYEGLGCVKDEVRSMELAHKSSDMGSKYGQLTLGQLYNYGGRHVRDDAQGVAFFRLAAAQGLDAAQYSLGCIYYTGIYRDDFRLNKDMAEVHRLFQLAAAQGYPYAIYRLAYFYDTGQGVNKNLNEAIRLFKRALAAGIDYAKTDIEKLEAYFKWVSRSGD